MELSKSPSFIATSCQEVTRKRRNLPIATCMILPLMQATGVGNLCPIINGTNAGVTYAGGNGQSKVVTTSCFCTAFRCGKGVASWLANVVPCHSLSYQQGSRY
jgi:hypothetical protein